MKKDGAMANIWAKLVDLLPSFLKDLLTPIVVAVVLMLLGLGGATVTVLIRDPTAVPPAEVAPRDPTVGATQSCGWRVIQHVAIREDPDKKSIIRKDALPDEGAISGPCGGQVTDTDGLTWIPVYCTCATDGIGWVNALRLKDLGPL